MTTGVDQTIMVEDNVGDVITVTIYDPATDAALDISSATTLEYRLRKPDATVATWTAAFTNDGTDGKIYYATVAGDLDQTGVWLLEARVVDVAGDWRTKTQIQFRVRGKI
jgi:hypothetical protein